MIIICSHDKYWWIALLQLTSKWASVHLLRSIFSFLTHLLFFLGQIFSTNRIFWRVQTCFSGTKCCYTQNEDSVWTNKQSKNVVFSMTAHYQTRHFRLHPQSRKWSIFQWRTINILHALYTCPLPHLFYFISVLSEMTALRTIHGKRCHMFILVQIRTKDETLTADFPPDASAAHNVCETLQSTDWFPPAANPP